MARIWRAKTPADCITLSALYTGEICPIQAWNVGATPVTETQSREACSVIPQVLLWDNGARGTPRIHSQCLCMILKKSINPPVGQFAQLKTRFIYVRSFTKSVVCPFEGLMHVFIICPQAAKL